MAEDRAVDRWFLRAADRGNPATELDRRHEDGLAWTAGNVATLLVHGERYFGVLHRDLCDTVAGDEVSFTDWRGDPDEQLVDGVTLREVLVDLVE